MTTATAAPTTRDLEEHIRSNLATIRKAWPHLLHPPAGHATRRPVPASRIPTNTDALSLRAEIARDLAYWAHAILDDHPTSRDTDHPLDLTDTPAVIAHLLGLARWASGWEHGNRLALELADHAHDARVLAWPRNAGTILLGDCPNTIGADGTPVTCGTPVRATAHHPGDIKCRGCGLTDTIDGWILRTVGHEALVTIPQLVPILHRRLGVVVSERTIRRWHTLGRIPASGGTPGKPLFDRSAVFAAVVRMDATDTPGGGQVDNR